MIQAGIGRKVNGRVAWLSEPAAAAYLRMLAAGCPAGGITDAGRTYEEQVEMYRLYLAGKLKATAARPGTSKHETGRALDLDDDGPNPRSWVRANGADFGWMRDRVKNEPWHFEYEVAHDKHVQEGEMPNLDDTDIRRIREEAVYPMLKEAEISKVIGEAVWTRLIDGVQAWTWLRDARLAADTPDSPTAAGVAALTDAQLALIAKAVNDEADKRARDRLS